MAPPPHLPPLDTRFEVKPAHIHSFYSPFAAPSPGLYTAYKVKDGDTLANIATRSGQSAKYLMSSCFGTTDPREVNWYLRNKVGCKEYGPKTQNFAFSTSADPGVIWLENRAYRKLTGHHMPAPNRYKVPRPLPGYGQKNDQGCWAASVGNMYDWKNYRTRRTSTKAVYEIGTDWGKKYDAEEYLRGPEFKNFARDAKLKSYPLGRFLDDYYWIDTLKRHGPFLMLQHARGDWLHWIIVAGYDWTAAGNLWGIVYDVGDKRYSDVKADVLYEKCLTAHTNYPRVYGY